MVSDGTEKIFCVPNYCLQLSSSSQTVLWAVFSRTKPYQNIVLASDIPEDYPIW